MKLYLSKESVDFTFTEQAKKYYSLCIRSWIDTYGSPPPVGTSIRGSADVESITIKHVGFSESTLHIMLGD